MAYIRKFKTGSNSTGVQVCYKKNGKVSKTVHIGSADTPSGVEKLLKKAQDVIDADREPLFNLKKFDRKK